MDYGIGVRDRARILLALLEGGREEEEDKDEDNDDEDLGNSPSEVSETKDLSPRDTSAIDEVINFKLQTASLPPESEVPIHVVQVRAVNGTRDNFLDGIFFRMNS